MTTRIRRAANARLPDPAGVPRGVSVLALAMPKCVDCFGQGAVLTANGTTAPCACVQRRVFRECLAAFKDCQENLGEPGAVRFERISRPEGRCAIIASFKRAEYVADFILTGRRALANYAVELAAFEEFLLTRIPPDIAVRLINRRLRLSKPLNKTSVSHAAYRAQQLIGKAILTARPHSLYPPRRYLAGMLFTARDFTQHRIPPRAAA